MHAEQAVIGVAIGYFAWDLFICVRYGFGVAFFIHAVLCLSLYSYAVGTVPPFLLYYGCVFLVWEVSTPFLNARHLMKAAGCGSGPVFENLQVWAGFSSDSGSPLISAWVRSGLPRMRMLRVGLWALALLVVIRWLASACDGVSRAREMRARLVLQTLLRLLL